MNILYLTDPQPDYLADQIYTGLCRILGRESVVDYPFKEIYHEPSKKVWYLPQIPGTNYTEIDVLGLLEARHFDFVCISSPRQVPINNLSSLSSKTILPPVVIIDGEDDSRIRYEIAETYKVRLYFKREYIWTNGQRVRRLKDYYNYVRSFHYNKGLFHKTHPLPFSVILDAIPQMEEMNRDIDVSFRGFVWSKGSRKRLQALRILVGMKSIRFSGGVYTPLDSTHRLPSERYYQELFRSRIAVSIRGGGFDTLRFWEILACKALLLCEQPDIYIPEALEDSKHAVFCKSDLSDLAELIYYYLDHEQERAMIAEEGHRHLLKYHTCERRAEYFLDLCKRVL